jgi:hypothetical protein
MTSWSSQQRKVASERTPGHMGKTISTLQPWVGSFCLFPFWRQCLLAFVRSLRSGWISFSSVFWVLHLLFCCLFYLGFVSHSNPCCVVCQTVSNSILISGVRFATLDNASPSDNSTVSQEQFLSIPSGWTLASNSSLTRQAALASPWGTECLTIRDGTALSTSTGRPCTRATQLVTVNDSTYRPAQGRVFISQIYDASPAMSNRPVTAMSVACIVTGVALIYATLTCL